VRAARVAGLALCWAGALAAQVPDAELVRRVDSLATAAISSGRAGGIAIGIARRGKVILERGYGEGITAETVFRIGSITKQFTAARILQLADSERIDLDADVTRYLPDAPTAGRRVTVRQLLNHTSGIWSYTTRGSRFWEVAGTELPHDSMLAFIRSQPPDFEPGTDYKYNNSGYYLLGMIIERVTGRSYGDDLRRTFFEPLHLSHTRFCPDAPEPGDAIGLSRQGDSLVPAQPIDMSGPFAAGGLCSTVGDLLTWSAALRDGRAAGQVFPRMASPDTLPGVRRLSYGYGLATGTSARHRVIEHGGGINGFVSALSWYPDDSLDVAILVNTEGNLADQLGSQVASVAFGVPLRVALDLPIPDSIAQRVMGTYRSDSVQARIFSAGGRLMLQLGGRSPTRLKYQGGYRFVPAATPEDVVRLDAALSPPVLAIVGPGLGRFRGARETEPSGAP
jgi:CubicO group peptidase (beta-lactamase class C family)